MRTVGRKTLLASLLRVEAKVEGRERTIEREARPMFFPAAIEKFFKKKKAGKTQGSANPATAKCLHQLRFLREEVHVEKAGCTARSLRRPAGEPIQDSPMDFFPLLLFQQGKKYSKGLCERSD